MRVLVEGNVEVWFFPHTPPYTATCIVKGFQVIINVLDLQILAIDPDISSSGILGQALRTVTKYRQMLIEAWDDMNP